MRTDRTTSTEARSTSLRSELTIESVTHAYGRKIVLSQASLRTRPGEVHCLLGPSGSGKTTLLRLVAGLEELQEGRIAFGPEEVATPDRHIPPEARAVGLVFQDYALFPHLDVRANVAFGLAYEKRSVRLERVRSLLAAVGMADFERAMPHTLSGGQQQRVALARALGRNPRVMLLDEPFSGLDSRLRDEVRTTTLEVLKSSGVATLMVTHDPHEAMMVADTISVIHAGRIEQTGTPKELYSQPVNERVATALGEANCFHGKVTQGRFSTPLGWVEAPSFADGDAVSEILRPESIAILPEASPSSVCAVVVAARQIGGSLRVAAKLPCGHRVIAMAPSNLEVDPGATIHLARAMPSGIRLVPYGG